MIKEVKDFCKKYKKEIIIVGVTLVAGGTIGAVVMKVLSDNKPKCGAVLPAGMNSISWEPNDSTINLERVKEILDLNSGNSEKFAIFKEGPGVDSYALILLGDIITEPQA
jgi:hypothetical protein